MHNMQSRRKQMPNHGGNSLLTVEESFEVRQRGVTLRKGEGGGLRRRDKHSGFAGSYQLSVQRGEGSACTAIVLIAASQLIFF